MKVVITFLFTFLIIYAQNVDEDSLATNIEDNLEIDENSINTTDYFSETLYYYRLNPININNAVYSDFAQFPFISHNTIIRILEYRNIKGKISNLAELLNLENVDYNEILNLLPYITTKNFNEKSFKGNFNIQSRSKILSDTSLNFNDRFEFINKFSYRNSNASLFFAQVKKSSDRAILSNYSYSFTIANLLGNDKLIVGNYKLKFGTGLCLNDGYITRSVITPNSEFKFNFKNTIPYKGTSPYTFNEGFSYEYQTNQFNFTTFYSQKHLSTKIDTNDNILSIYSSRYDDKSQIISKRLGTILSYNFDLIYLSFLYENLTLSKSFLLSNKKYSSINTYSLYINFLTSNLLLNSEIAYQNKSFFCEISGTYRLSKNFSFGHQYIKMGNNILLASNKLNGFYKPSTDIEIFYNTMTYSFGKENIFTYTIYQKTMPLDINKFTQIDNKYAIGYINQNSNIISHLLTISYSQKDYTNQDRKQISTRYSFKISPTIRTNYTTDIRITSNTKSTGYAFSEMLYFTLNNNFTLKTKFNYFSIENYDNIIYTFENDLDGNITSNVLYKDGFSAYLILKYQKQNFGISLKYFYKYQEKINEIIKQKENSYTLLQFDYEI